MKLNTTVKVPGRSLAQLALASLLTAGSTAQFAAAQVYVNGEQSGQSISGYANPAAYTSTNQSARHLTYRDVYGTRSARQRVANSAQPASVATHSSILSRSEVPFSMLLYQHGVYMSMPPIQMASLSTATAALSRQQVPAPAPLAQTGSHKPVDPAFVPLTVHYDIYGPQAYDSGINNGARRTPYNPQSDFHINDYYGMQRWNEDAWRCTGRGLGYNWYYDGYGYGSWYWSNWYGGYWGSTPVIIYQNCDFNNKSGSWSHRGSFNNSGGWGHFTRSGWSASFGGGRNGWHNNLNSCGDGLSFHIRF